MRPTMTFRKLVLLGLALGGVLPATGAIHGSGSSPGASPLSRPSSRLSSVRAPSDLATWPFSHRPDSSTGTTVPHAAQ